MIVAELYFLCFPLVHKLQIHSSVKLNTADSVFWGIFAPDPHPPPPSHSPIMIDLANRQARFQPDSLTGSQSWRGLSRYDRIGSHEGVSEPNMGYDDAIDW